MQHSPRPELPAAVPPLSFAPQRTTGALSFPHGATAVTIDEKGRIKLPTRLGGLRSWCEGALDVVIVAGWAVITQPDGHHTKQMTRNRLGLRTLWCWAGERCERRCELDV